MLRWWKIWTKEWARSTTRFELTSAERSVWIDIINEAAWQDKPGRFVLLNYEQFAHDYNHSLDLVKETFKKCSERPIEKIAIKTGENGKIFVTVLNFAKYNPEAVKRAKENPESKELFDFWNSLEIVKHRRYHSMLPYINSALEHCSKEEIKKAMENYNMVLKSDKYFWSYSWTLYEFLSRKTGLERFLPENFNEKEYLKNAKKHLSKDEQRELERKRFLEDEND